jgi:hypothetical protein
LRIIFLGKVFRWQHPDMLNKFGRNGDLTYFYYEPGGEFATGTPNTQSRSTVALHRIWANAPRLDVTPGWGSNSYSGLLQSFAGGSSNIQIPINLLDTTTQTWWYNPNQFSSNRLAVKGDGYFEGRLRTRLSQFSNNRNIPVSYDTVDSDAPGSQANNVLTTLKSSDWLNSIPVGTTINTTYWGTFGANDNAKTILIDSAGTRFTTGPLSANNIPWELQILRTRSTSVSHRLYFKFTTTSTTVMSAVNFNIGDTYLAYSLQGIGTNTNDVVLYGGTTQINYPVNS